MCGTRLPSNKQIQYGLNSIYPEVTFDETSDEYVSQFYSLNVDPVFSGTDLQYELQQSNDTTPMNFILINKVQPSGPTTTLNTQLSISSQYYLATNQQTDQWLGPMMVLTKVASNEN
jgi:hypothetical protein